MTEVSSASPALRDARSTPFEVVSVTHAPWRAIEDPPVLSLREHQMRVDTDVLSVTLAYGPWSGLPPSLPVGRWAGVLQSLDAVPDHKEAGAGLLRFGFLGAPMHSALHQVMDTNALDMSYCSIHRHDDEGEFNLMLPAENATLDYEVYETTWTTFRAPTQLWFSRGVAHGARAVSGIGFFFVLRLPAEP
jgi:hypothetical protein